MYVCMYLSIYLSVCLSVCLSISISLSIYMCTCIYYIYIICRCIYLHTADVARHTQSFFRGHDAPLTALARRDGGDEVASGQTKGGAGQSPMLCIWRYAHASRRCALLAGV